MWLWFSHRSPVHLGWLQNPCGISKRTTLYVIAGIAAHLSSWDFCLMQKIVKRKERTLIFPIQTHFIRFRNANSLIHSSHQICIFQSHRHGFCFWCCCCLWSRTFSELFLSDEMNTACQKPEDKFKQPSSFHQVSLIVP